MTTFFTVTLTEIFLAVDALESEVSTTPAGAPELVATMARIAEVQGELDRTRGLMGSLIPDAGSPPTYDQETAASLERALGSLMAAARIKR